MSRTDYRLRQADGPDLPTPTATAETMPPVYTAAERFWGVVVLVVAAAFLVESPNVDAARLSRPARSGRRRDTVEAPRPDDPEDEAPTLLMLALCLGDVLAGSVTRRCHQATSAAPPLRSGLGPF